jgi:hypothetical protein
VSRTAIFEAVRAARTDKTFDLGEIHALDAMLDTLGVPPATPAAAAPAAGVKLPDEYWPLLAKIESSDNPLAKAATSTGSGLYQFLKATWIGEGGGWGIESNKPFGGLTPSREEQTARAKTFTMKNAVILLRGGIGINKASLYAAHFLGAPMAVKLLSAAGNVGADTIAGPAATAANPSILRGKSVAQFKAWLKAKTGDDV